MKELADYDSDHIFDLAHGLGIDIETKDPDLTSMGSGVRREDTYVVGVALSAYNDKYEVVGASYYPLRHKDRDSNVDIPKFLAWLQERITNARELIGTNLIYDLEYLILQEKIEFEIMEVGRRIYIDVQIAEPIIDENKRGEYSLEALAKHYGYKGKDSDELYQWLADNHGGKATRATQAGRIHLAPAEVVAPYAISDVVLPVQIYQKQRQLLHKNDLSETWLLERDLFPMIIAMKMRGVRIDTKKAASADKEMQAALDAERGKLAKLGIAPNAALSIQKYCDAFDIEYPLTATGLPSFTKPFLSKHDDDVLRLVAAVRRLEKNTGTFIKGILKHCTKFDRIHCQFNQLKSDKNGTVSGRFSSSNPNLQNQPARDDEFGPLVRSLYIPEEGEDWGSADYSQIEYMLLVEEACNRLLKTVMRKIGDKWQAVPVAEESQPPGYKAAIEMRERIIEGIKTGKKVDIHQEVATLCDIERPDGKAINFGMVYGLGLDALIASLKKARSVCTEIIASYHKGMPFAKIMYNEMQKEAKAGKPVVTVGGRQRRFSKVQLNVPWTWTRKGTPLPPFDEYMSKSGGGWKRDNAKRPPIFKNISLALDFYNIVEKTEVEGEEVEGKLYANNFEFAFCHTALNALLQGGAADIMKRAMLDIWNAGICLILGAPLLTIHDELNWSIPRTDEAKEAFYESVRIMEAVYSDRISIPLKVDAEIGGNWSECK